MPIRITTTDEYEAAQINKKFCLLSVHTIMYHFRYKALDINPVGSTVLMRPIKTNISYQDWVIKQNRKVYKYSLQISQTNHVRSASIFFYSYQNLKYTLSKKIKLIAYKRGVHLNDLLKERLRSRIGSAIFDWILIEKRLDF